MLAHTLTQWGYTYCRSQETNVINIDKYTRLTNERSALLTSRNAKDLVYHFSCCSFHLFSCLFRLDLWPVALWMQP